MAASTALQVLVAPLLGTVFDNLSSLVRTEFGLLRGVNKELEKLSSTISTIKDVLEDAEMKQITNKPIQNWLRKLKDVTYDAEDVLDEFATESALRHDHQIEITQTNKSCNNIHEVLTNSVSSCFDFRQLSFRRKIAKRIKELREKFDEIAKERYKFHLSTNLIPGDIESGGMHRRQISSFPVPQVFGREEDKEHIVNQLLNNTEVDGNDVSVCAILGMGGLGKTTLAQMVHHDDRIVKHFEVRCWVCVSEDFDPITLFRAIIESSGGSTQDLQNIDPVQHRLRERLGGKRFLVVLDDVWSEDQAKWEILKYSLSCGSKGSSIIVTTLLDKVASIMATFLIFRPDILSDDDCWSLFKHRAFDMCNKTKENHPTLEAIGKQIVKKCGGIPLAAKFLGGLLRFKRKDNEWLSVRDSDIWDLPQDKSDAILPALRLSYEHLPLQLRQCFVYCSIFPKDYIIEKETLIHLWMANGFIQSKGNMELEDVGDAIFDDLSCRSFFQPFMDFEKDEDVTVSNCIMHDLVHDLACSIMRDECLVMEVGKENFVGIRGPNTRHLSLHYKQYSWSSSNSFFLEIPLHMRTLLIKSWWNFQQTPPLQLVFSRLKRLRALDLSYSDLSTLPDSIGNLKHLRYLDLSHTYIISLPNESLCSLKNLQVLKLNDCFKLRALPQDMWKMSSLRHLEIISSPNINRTPIWMGKLICLQTLSLFIVGTESGRGIPELQGLDRLKGKLVIKGLEHVRNSIDAKNANLIKKQNLHSLTLSWSEDRNNTTEEEKEKEKEEGLLLRVGESLQPHPFIKRLHIEGFGCATLPSWMMRAFSCLPNLVKVTLANCKRCKHLSSLGELPLLKDLSISGMDSVKCIGDEFYRGDHHNRQALVFFPSLDNLNISSMHNLEEFSSPSSLPSSSSGSSNQLLAFPCLRKLRIWDCLKLRRLISLPSSLVDLSLRFNQLVLSRSLENLPPCLSRFTIGLSDEVISFPKVERMMWMRLWNLTLLTISNCPKLKTLPEELMENLTALTCLTIEGCDEFIHLPDGMQYLKSLSYFRINNCGSLKSLQGGLRHLTTLESLRIDCCPELEFLPEDDDDFKHLISLRTLYLWGLPKVTSLPTVAGWSQENNNNTVPTLESLSIDDCSAMTTLPDWIPNLTSLRELVIHHCDNMKFLPNEGLQRLTALQRLRIVKCHPDLHRRCEKDKGDDWHKISHIPGLYIKYQ